MPPKKAATTRKRKVGLSKQELEELVDREFELLEDHIYRFKYKDGLVSESILENPRFEVLYEMGAIALLDGYHREAIASFAASLERYFEFHVRVIVHANGIAADAYKTAWNHLARQSERQLGAFVMIGLLTSREAPAVLPEPLVKLRNDVIHRGKIASRTDALQFGEAVLEIIRKHLRFLWKNYREAVPAVAKKSVHENVPLEIWNRNPRSTNWIGMIVGSRDGGESSSSLEKELVALKHKRGLLYPRFDRADYYSGPGWQK